MTFTRTEGDHPCEQSDVSVPCCGPVAEEEGQSGAADRQATLSPKKAAVACACPAQGFPPGGSGRLWAVELVKVESHEDMAVFALERAPPTDWPGKEEGKTERKDAFAFVKRQRDQCSRINMSTVTKMPFKFLASKQSVATGKSNKKRNHFWV